MLRRPQYSREPLPQPAAGNFGAAVIGYGSSDSPRTAFASKSAAAFAASNVSARPSKSKSERSVTALRRISQIGTPSCVNTNNISSPTSANSAGLGHSVGRGFHSMSPIGFLYSPVGFADFGGAG